MFPSLLRFGIATTLMSSCVAAAAAGGPLDLSSGSVSFGDTPEAGAFSDVYTFTLPTASFLSSSITTAGVGGQVVDLTSVTFTTPSGQTWYFTQLLPPGFQTWGFGGYAPAGHYTMTVAGTNGPDMGSFAGVVAVAPQVPEPASVALLLLGLVAIGARMFCACHGPVARVRPDF